MKKIRVPILNEEYAVYVVWGMDYKKIKTWIQWHFDSKIPEEHFDMFEMRGRTFHIRGYMPIIWMNQKTKADFARFLGISLGSTNEIEYYLLLSRDLKYIDFEKYESLSHQLVEIRKMLLSLECKVLAKT